MRLNKLLARRGLGARRKCDALIRSGAVRVNGIVVTEPGTQVEPERDRVRVNGRPLPAEASHHYYALHKPVGVISTLNDPEGRPTVRDLLPPGSRLFPVGRLDADTSGLLILTNDGDLAHHLMHPRYGVEKSYRVRLDRSPDPMQLERLRRGVEFEPGVVSGPARVRPFASEREGGSIEITIHEGRYRQVRRMCEAVGLKVVGLHRSAYGPLRLGPLARGMWRELSGEEVRRLRQTSARARPRPPGAHPRGRRGTRDRGEGRRAEQALRPLARGLRPTERPRRGEQRTTSGGRRSEQRTQPDRRRRESRPGPGRRGGERWSKSIARGGERWSRSIARGGERQEHRRDQGSGGKPGSGRDARRQSRRRPDFDRPADRPRAGADQVVARHRRGQNPRRPGRPGSSSRPRPGRRPRSRPSGR